MKNNARVYRILASPEILYSVQIDVISIYYLI